MEFEKVQDSGKRESFVTGSRRDTREKKGRFDLVPAYPLYRIARLYEDGADKYGEHNWSKGQPISRYLDSCLRHINKFMMKMKDEDHLAQACWNLMSIIDHIRRIEIGKLPKKLDDREAWPEYEFEKVMQEREILINQKETVTTSTGEARVCTKEEN